MGTCKDCKFWSPEGLQNPEDKGTCEKVCFSTGSKLFKISVKVDDDQGLDYNLITGPEFGCVLFEKKD